MLLQIGCGGVIHFASYLLLLKAYESASSTEITPLLQMSAVWLLPIATLDAFYDGDTTVHPVHLLGLIFIVVGGLLPVTAGQVGLMLSPAFWQKSAVGYCLVSELMVAMYTLLLHQNSFDQVRHESGTTAVVVDHSELAIPVWQRDDVRAVIQFFVLCRYASGVFAFLTYAIVPSLRRQVLDMLEPAPDVGYPSPLRTLPLSSVAVIPDQKPLLRTTNQGAAKVIDGAPLPLVSTPSREINRKRKIGGCSPLTLFIPDKRRHKALTVKVVGDLFSLTGLLVDSVAYALYYEPTVINASEGGLQQLLNLVFAVFLSRVFRFGRSVDNLQLKIVSFGLVTIGLVLSCL
jgi:hypothetical protein